jgi:hypothetical protein
MSFPVFIWLSAFCLDVGLLALMLYRRPVNGRALIVLFVYKVACLHPLLFLFRDQATLPGWTTYAILYCVTRWIQAALICWVLFSLAYYATQPLYYAALLSLTAAVVSMYCAEPAPFGTLLMQAADRLCWLAPASFLIWGMIDPPPRISRRNTYLYIGFVVLIAGELVLSFAHLAGLRTSLAAVLYPVVALTWMIALMQPEPELSLARIPQQLEVLLQAFDISNKHTEHLAVARKAIQGVALANERRKAV